MADPVSIVFDPVTHRYTVNGIVWPSVTQVLGVLQDWSRVPQHALRAAQQFGAHVHLACHLWDKQRLDEDALDAHLAPYLAGWRRFLAESGAEVIASELVVGHRDYQVAGTLDRVVQMHGETVLIDIKTGSALPITVGPQTAAYAKLLEQSTDMRPRRRACVQLMPHNYRLHPLREPADWSTFLSALNVHRFRETHRVDVQ